MLRVSLTAGESSLKLIEGNAWTDDASLLFSHVCSEVRSIHRCFYVFHRSLWSTPCWCRLEFWWKSFEFHKIYCDFDWNQTKFRIDRICMKSSKFYWILCWITRKFFPILVTMCGNSMFIRKHLLKFLPKKLFSLQTEQAADTSTKAEYKTWSSGIYRNAACYLISIHTNILITKGINYGLWCFLKKFS